jgi:NAD(P)-dependent dehydrogenase (short-subunit alcohol dehydrogenase family)
MAKLKGRVAVVAGATRGAGRGIACALGEAGATVYCTGRSVRGAKKTPRKRTKETAFDLERRPETIEETAEMVSARGGVGIHVQVDHTDAEQVASLFRRVREEQGRLDVLVNDIWGGDFLTEWGKPFWECSLEKGLTMIERAVHTHIITARHALPLMIERKRGLVVEITDGEGLYYRGQFFYDFVKTSVIRLAFAQDRVGRRLAGLPALRGDARTPRRHRRELARGREAESFVHRIRDASPRRSRRRRVSCRSEGVAEVGKSFWFVDARRSV